MTALSEPLVVATPRLRRARLAVLAHPKILAGVAILAFFVLMVHPSAARRDPLGGQGQHLRPAVRLRPGIAHPSAPSGGALARDELRRAGRLLDVRLRRATDADRGAQRGDHDRASSRSCSARSPRIRGGWFDGFVSHLSDAMVLLPAMVAVFILGIGRPNDEFGAPPGRPQLRGPVRPRAGHRHGARRRAHRRRPPVHGRRTGLRRRRVLDRDPPRAPAPLRPRGGAGDDRRDRGGDRRRLPQLPQRDRRGLRLRSDGLRRDRVVRT